MKTAPERMLRSFLTMIMIAASLLTNGCWDSHEVDTMAIVGSMAIDRGQEGRILVSLEVMNAEALARAVGQESPGSVVAAWVMSEEGNTISNAISNIQRRTPRRLFMGQVSTVIFGQNAARDGIGDYLDYFTRHPQLRRSIRVSTCDTGTGLLMRPFMNEVPSLTLTGLNITAPDSGRTMEVTINELIRRLRAPGIEPITMHTAGRKSEGVMIKRQGEQLNQTNKKEDRKQPLVSEHNIPGIVPPESELLETRAESGTGEYLEALTIVVGLAAYRNDRLVGFLDGNDARGYLWTTGQIANAVVEIEDTLADPARMTFLVSTCSPSTRMSVVDGEPRARIDVSVTALIREMNRGLVAEELRERRRLERELESWIRREIENSLNIVQSLQSDIYGFGNLLYRSHPDLWRELEDRWNEEVFPNLEVSVNVTVRVDSSGDLLR